jgi:hypothetical protein
LFDQIHDSGTLTENCYFEEWISCNNEFDEIFNILVIECLGNDFFALSLAIVNGTKVLECLLDIPAKTYRFFVVLDEGIAG